MANRHGLAESSLNALVERSGWSKFYFLREFHRVTGETPKQYLQRVRLEKAAAKLNSNDLTVLEIALDAGFRSHEVFTKAFRKQFGLTPSQYRKRMLDHGNGDFCKVQYRSFIDQTSPCIGLFHLNGKTKPRSVTMKDMEITRLTLEPQPILFIQRKLDQDELQQNMAECFGQLFSHGMQQGLAITGQPIARYTSIGPGLWTVDFVLPFSKVAEAVDDMQSGFLEGGTVVKGVHYGPYDALAESYVAIEKWLEKAGLFPRSANWEQYVTSPAEVPDPSDWRTDIYWPVE